MSLDDQETRESGVTTGGWRPCFLLVGEVAQAFNAVPVCICWKAFVLGGGFSSILGLLLWGWHCLKGTSQISGRDVVSTTVVGWLCIVCCILRYRSGWERGLSMGRKMVQWFPYFRLLLPWLGKFGPSKGMRRMLWEYKERLTVEGQGSLVWNMWQTLWVQGPCLMSPSPSSLSYYWVYSLWHEDSKAHEITVKWVNVDLYWRWGINIGIKVFTFSFS